MEDDEVNQSPWRFETGISNKQIRFRRFRKFFLSLKCYSLELFDLLNLNYMR